MTKSLLPFGKSIKTQLIVLLFALTGISIMVVGFLGVRGVLDSGHQAEKITTASVRERAKDVLAQTANATADKNSLIFTNAQKNASAGAEYVKGLFEHQDKFSNNYWKFDASVHAIAPHNQLSNSATEPSSVFIPAGIGVTPDMKRKTELTAYLDFFAPQLIKDDKNDVALYYIGTGGETRYYPNIGLATASPPDFNPTTANFFTVADPVHDPGKSAQWTGVYNDPAGKGLMITASHPIYANGVFAGVMGSDVTLAHIAKNIEDYSPLESSYAFLIDKSGRAVAFPAQAYTDMLDRTAKSKEFGPDLSKVSGSFEPVLKNMRASKNGFAELNVKGRVLYVAYAPLAGTNFSLGIVAKKEVLLKVVSDLKRQVSQSSTHVLYLQILPIAALILLFVWIVGYFYIRFITNPIIVLTEKINRIAANAFIEELKIDAPPNEVGQLADAFHKVLRELSGSYQVLQRKLVEIGRAKAKDDAILNSIGDGLIVTDDRGRIMLINEIAAELLGLNRAEVIGRELSNHHLFDDKGTEIPPSKRPMQVTLDTGQKVTRDVMSLGKDASKHALSVTATPVVENGQTIGTIQIIRDITKAKEVDRMKTEFISIASHQLRTPLSAVKWFGEMLLHGDAGPLQGEQIEFVRNISLSTNRMIELVSALLNISRMESGRIIIEPVPTNLGELVSSIAADLRPKANAHQNSITVVADDDLPKVSLDPQLISQVYINLLANAINYTPKDGRIKVRIYTEGSEIVSQISDNGYGIPKGEQSQVFQKFFRGSNVMQVETDGTGLGIYLVKIIIESSGGRIWFESEENKGTTVWFSLPLAGMKAKKGEVKLDERSYGPPK